jgi:hypothetical protein
MASESHQPLLRIVNTDATPEESAALVAVLASLQTPTVPVCTSPPGWSASTRMQRRTPPHGPGGWRSSSLCR